MERLVLTLKPKQMTYNMWRLSAIDLFASSEVKIIILLNNMLILVGEAEKYV